MGAARVSTKVARVAFGVSRTAAIKVTNHKSQDTGGYKGLYDKGATMRPNHYKDCCKGAGFLVKDVLVKQVVYGSFEHVMPIPKVLQFRELLHFRPKGANPKPDALSLEKAVGSAWISGRGWLV